MPPTTKMQVEEHRQVVDGERARDDRLVLAPLPDRQPERGAERGQGERGHDAAAHDGRPEQADEQHDHDAAGQRDDGREAGPVDVRALDVGEGDDHGVPPCAGTGCTGACACAGSAGAAAAAGAGGLAISCAGRTAALTSRSERASGSCG